MLYEVITTADDDLGLDDLGDVKDSVVVDTAVELDAVGEAVVVLAREASYNFV